MTPYRLKISSPDGDIFNGDVLSLRLRSALGDIAIMAGHIPFYSYILPCECKIELDESNTKCIKLKSGVISVTSDIVTLLTGELEEG